MPQPAPERDPRLLLPTLLLIGLISSVVSSLGAPLLVTIARKDHVSLGTAQWSLTVTQLVGAVVAPICGRLGDGRHRRTVVLFTLSAVFVGSVVAALPVNSLPILLLGRGLQGIGLGLLPLTMTVAREHLTKQTAATAIALLSAVTFVGVGLGYPVTGLLDEAGGLHAPFWFGAGASALALGCTVFVLPGSRHLKSRRLDVPGAVLLGLGLTCFLVAVAQAEPWGWASPRTLGLFVASVLLAVVWVRRELSAVTPLVDLRLLRHPAIVVTNSTALVIALAMYISMPLITDFSQTPKSAGYGFGASVVVSGLMLLPLSTLTAAVSRVAVRLGERIGPQRVVSLGALITVVPTGMFAVSGGALWEGFVAMGLAGIGIGCSFATMPGLIVRAVRGDETGSAMGFYQVVRYIGFSLGSGLSASILAAYTRHGSAFPRREGFTVAMLLGSFLCLVAAVANVVLARRAAAPDGPAPLAPPAIVDDVAVGSAAALEGVAVDGLAVEERPE